MAEAGVEVYASPDRSQYAPGTYPKRYCVNRSDENGRLVLHVGWAGEYALRGTGIGALIQASPVDVKVDGSSDPGPAILRAKEYPSTLKLQAYSAESRAPLSEAQYWLIGDRTLGERRSLPEVGRLLPSQSGALIYEVPAAERPAVVAVVATDHEPLMLLVADNFPEGTKVMLNKTVRTPSSIRFPVSRAETKKAWETEYGSWRSRSLEGKRYVYLWADGIYFNVRLEGGTTERCGKVDRVA